MPLPYPIKVVLPFDIATAQDMNERHANDVALANGSGLDDGAVTGGKIDLPTITTTASVPRVSGISGNLVLSQTGKQITVHGVIEGTITNGMRVATIPAQYRPSANHSGIFVYFNGGIPGGGFVVKSNGYLQVYHRESNRSSAFISGAWSID